MGGHDFGAFHLVSTYSNHDSWILSLKIKLGGVKTRIWFGFWNVRFEMCCFAMRNQGWSFETLKDSIIKLHKKRLEETNERERWKREDAKIQEDVEDLVSLVGYSKKRGFSKNITFP